MTSQQITDTVTPLTYGASAFTIVAGLTINEWVAVSGLVLGMATFWVNLYYKHIQHKSMMKRYHSEESE